MIRNRIERDRQEMGKEARKVKKTRGTYGSEKESSR